jgi:hypothetical protein
VSLAITNVPLCGFGNRILYYYNLRQLSLEKGCGFFCVPWEGVQYFEGDLLGTPSVDGNYENLNFCLGEKFYDNISTRQVFNLKQKIEIESGTCAVHFRGTDFHSWNPDAVLKKDYYCDSIIEVEEEIKRFILFTDDPSLESFQVVVNYLKQRNIDFYVGQNTHNRNQYIRDFSIMSECDTIISSPSTFCISAGFVGKKKKIIHSKKWVTDRVNKEDKFWVDLYNGGNEDYKTWRLM